MFTQKNPRTAAGTTRITRIAASVGVLALGSGLALASPMAAAADDEIAQSYAEGLFLSGTLLGGDLAGLVSVTGAEAFNDGTQATQTVKDPFSVTALSAVTVGSGSSVQIPLGDVIQAGAISQYAQAAKDGVSVGASGAVAQDGAIGVGADSSAPLGSTTVDLESLGGSRFADTVTELKLELKAIAARAEGDRSEASGDYSISGATLHFTSPAISDLSERVDRSLDVVIDELDSLAGDDGELLALVTKLVRELNPALNLLGADADVSATINTSRLRDAVRSLLSTSYRDSGVRFDLETGVVSVDLARYAGNLNELPVNTEILTDEIVSQILHAITDTVAGLADEIVAKVEDVIRDLEVSIRADLSLDVAQAPVVKEVCRTVEKIIQVPTLVPVEGGGGLDGLIGGIVGGVTGTVEKLVDKVVSEVVCEKVTTVLDPLKTTVDLDIDATIDELIRGVGVDASLTAKVASVPVKLNLALVTDELGTLLDGRLFTGRGVVGDLVDALNANVVDPALTGLLGGSSSVSALLSDVISVRVNLQETTIVGGAGLARGAGSYFTQTAVRVSALNGELATINLASATVGPNTTSGGPGDPGDPDDPDCVDDCVAGGGGSSVPSALATTGVGIAILVAVILALLAAGAYMVRESYRRSKEGSALA